MAYSYIKNDSSFIYETKSKAPNYFVLSSPDQAVPYTSQDFIMCFSNDVTNEWFIPKPKLWAIYLKEICFCEQGQPKHCNSPFC